MGAAMKTTASVQDCVDKVSRRFLLQVLAAGGAASSLPLTGDGPALAQDEAGGPIDCGPPPRAAPQSRTGGESFPPLPLPATPLRRTEKKRPPAPPALIGKASLGPVRFVTRDGQRVAYRDWMTDPADVDSLLNWTNSELGIRYRSVEVDLADFSYDPRELPAILLAGHQDFTLPEAVRTQLARYILDGGLILGDACCGWPDFDAAFRREIGSLLPGRPLAPLLPDDPLYAAYYKLGNFTYQEADGSQHTDPPCLEGVQVGCRLGVIYSPADLTCGWDGHDHPRGKRVVIEQARQIGANYVTYLLGQYQLARFQSTTKIFHEADAPTRDEFTFAQLTHEGDWDPDPSAVHNLLRFAREESTLEVKFKRATYSLSDATALRSPLLYLTGHEEFHWTDAEAGQLGRYLQAGGMLLADACCGRLAFDRALRRELARALPDVALEPLPADHPLYHAHFDIEQVAYTPRTREDFGGLSLPTLEGATLDGRLAVVYSRFDLGNGWEQFPHPYSYGYGDDDALRIGLNVLVYAVTH